MDIAGEWFWIGIVRRWVAVVHSGTVLSFVQYVSVCSFVIGCGLTFLETAANPYATELGAKETAASRLNFAQSFNGLGCICAPVLVGLLLFSEDGNSGAGNVALPYVGMGIVVLLVALVFSKIKLPEIEHGVEVDKDGHKVGLWSHKLFIFGLLALFAYEIGEISINSFLSIM